MSNAECPQGYGPAGTLQGLRRIAAGLVPLETPQLVGVEALRLGVPAVDDALGGGLSRGALHELAPKTPADLGSATGFTLALAALPNPKRGTVLWIATKFAGIEGGGLYAPGADLFGVTASRLVMLGVPRPVDVLWAMEEALRCRALAAVVAEWPGEEVELTQTRRLALAAREGAGFGILLQHRAAIEASAAATRWRIAAGRSRPDRFRGLGVPAFDLSLIKNRRGPTGRWFIAWDQQKRAFHESILPETISLGVAEAALDRSDRTPARRAG
jgi:protein ImuA